MQSIAVVMGLDALREDVFRFRVKRRLDLLEQEYEETFADGCTRTVEEQAVELAQRLMLLNDGLLHQGTLARDGSALAGILEASAIPVDRVDAIYVRVLTREPTEVERAKAVGFVKGIGGREGYEDLMFALMSSSEFLTRH